MKKTDDATKRAQKIGLIVFDIDGVMTDGGLYFSDTGAQVKRFHSQDGLGIQMLQASGIIPAVITSRRSETVARRMHDLNIEHYYQGCHDKSATLEKLGKKLALEKSQIAYVGDDVIDLPAMRISGFAIAVQNAHPSVKHHAHFITEKTGGDGAVREVCDFLLESQGKLNDALSRFLEKMAKKT